MAAVKQQKTATIADIYGEGDFIDAKDNQGDWRVGYIVAKIEQTKIFKVRFDGWALKYDEPYKFTSLKLKPFRTIVHGYTGQMQNPGMRESWKLSNISLEDKTAKLKQFMASPSNLNVHEQNQLIRGHNYMVTDFLMAEKYASLKSFGSAMNHFIVNLQFLVKYLKHIENNFSKFLRIIDNQQDMSLWTIEQAFFKSYYEVFDTGYIISGNYARFAGFFRDNQECIRDYWQVSQTKDAKSVYQTQILKIFYQLKGLQILQSLTDKILQTEEIVNFMFLHSFTNLVSGMTSLITNDFRVVLIQKTIKIAEKNINKLKDVHFKDFHKHNVSNFLKTIVDMSSRTKYEAIIQNWTIGLQLQLCLKMMTCPYFQKKLKGINHIIQVCQKNQHILKNDFLKKWMRKVGLLEILFNNDNQEFIKKSCELVKFLNIKHNIEPQDIDLIWKSRTGKHQTILKQIYNLISEFPLYENNIKQNLKLFQKISTLPEEQWDEDYIHMIREFSINSYGLNVKEKLTQTFGFKIIYAYVLKTESEFSIGQLNHLLNKFQKSKMFTKFQITCFQSIGQNIKVWTHIKILLSLYHQKIQSFNNLEIDMINILIQFLNSNAQNSNSKMVNDGFELLDSVIKCIAKDMSVDELFSLWKVYIHSLNRESLLKWILSRKQSRKVSISNCLTDKHRKDMLSKLWNDSQDIKTMDQNEVYIFIEIFKCVNIIKQKMKRTGFIIKPNSLELDGYDKIWIILKHSDNPKVVTAVCDLLAEIHTCYIDQNLEISISELVANIAASIMQAQKQQKLDFLKKILLLAKTVILRDQQIFPFTFTPRVNIIREYSVLLKQRNEQKIIRFNCTCPFYQFKKILSDKFNLPLHHMVVYNSKHQVITYDSYFKSMNQSVFIGGKFQIVEDIDNQKLVKTYFNKKLDLFFELLDDSRIQKLVWNIVQKLPISIELKFKIVDTQDILQELQHVSFYKQLYMLKVMDELEEEWWLKFSNTVNLQRLIANFQKINFRTHIEQEYLATLTKLIVKMLKISEDYQHFDIPKQLFSDSLALLKNMLQNIQKTGSKSLDLEIKIIRNLFTIGLSINHDENVTHTLLNYQSVQELLVLGLISISNQPIRKVFCEQLRLLLKDMNLQCEIKLIVLLLSNLFKLAISWSNRDTLRQYFQITSVLLAKSSPQAIQNYLHNQGKQLANTIYDLLKNQKPEKSIQNPNVLLIGYLSLLKHLTQQQPKQLQKQIANFVIHECLFSDDVSKCKSKQARSQALNLLRSLLCNHEIVLSTTSFLSQLHRNGQWRTRRLEDWTINSLQKMKSTSGYVGLKNLGCICYMNSFMQQLYMMPNFRRSLTSCEDPNFREEEVQENLLYQIQKMFLNLENSDKKFYIPKDFCHSFKDYEGNPTNVIEQMDIDQFSNILFDRVQSLLKNTSQTTLVEDTFGGVFSNQIVCKGCPHYSETQERFLSISLTVKNKKNIYQSFDTMIKGDTLDGDNAYFCERCNKKVSAVKRVSLKKLPNYLIVTLKRFEFDYEKMMKLKVNDYCEFPINLNLKEYSRQYLRKQESTKIIEEQEDQSNDYYNYVLKGVVVHSGYADSGHYYSFIQDRNTTKWFQFNDTVVRDFDINDLAEETFGGQTSGYDVKQKIRNAYMLIYEREKKIPVAAQSLIREQTKLVRGNEPILQDIQRQNKYQKIQSILFSSEYNKFVSNILQNLQYQEEKLQKIILKYIITVFLTINIRQKSDGTMYYNLLKRIQHEVQKNADIGQWVLELFSQQRILDQFFKNNFMRDVKKLLAFWLARLYKNCSGDSQRYFLNLLLNKLVQENQNILEFCLILYEVASQSSSTLDYLVENNVVGRFIQNVMGKDPRVYAIKLQILPDVDSDIGNQIIIERSQQEISKKAKFDNENTYIWALINLAIARSQQKGLVLEDYLTKIECDYLQLSQDKNYKILQQIKNRFQMYEFINLMAYLSKSNKQYMVIALNQTYTGLKEFQSKRYRQFFLLFEKLINVSQKYKQIRVQFFKKLVDALIHNEQYSLDSNIIQQWIIILLNRNPVLRKYLAGESVILEYLHKLTAKKTPSEEIARKNGSYGEFMLNKLHGVKFPRSKKNYVKLSEEMNNFYELIIEDKFEQSNKWPSFHQTERRLIKVGDVVSYFDSKDRIQYEQAKVESIFLGRVELSLKKGKNIQTWVDDQKISYDVKHVQGDDDDELNSSRTTEMDIEDQDVFDDI